MNEFQTTPEITRKWEATLLRKTSKHVANFRPRLRQIEQNYFSQFKVRVLVELLLQQETRPVSLGIFLATGMTQVVIKFSNKLLVAGHGWKANAGTELRMVGPVIGLGLTSTDKKGHQGNQGGLSWMPWSAEFGCYHILQKALW